MAENTPESPSPAPKKTLSEQELKDAFDAELKAGSDLNSGIRMLTKDAEKETAKQETNIAKAKEALADNEFKKQTKYMAINIAEMTAKNPQRYREFSRNSEIQMSQRVTIFNETKDATKESLKDDPEKMARFEEIQSTVTEAYNQYAPAFEERLKNTDATPKETQYLQLAKMIGGVAAMERAMNAYDELRGDYSITARLYQPEVDRFVKVSKSPRDRKYFDDQFMQAITECDTFLEQHANDPDPVAKRAMKELGRAKKLFEEHHPNWERSAYDKQMVFMTKKIMELELMTYNINKEAERLFPDEPDTENPSALAESEQNPANTKEATTAKPVAAEDKPKPQIMARGGSKPVETVVQKTDETKTEVKTNTPPPESAEEIAAKETKAKEVAAQRQKEIAARKAAEAEQQAKALAASEADLAIAATEKKNDKKEKPSIDIGKELAEQEARELAAQKEASRIALEKATAAKKAAEKAKIAAEKKAEEEAKLAAQRKAAEETKVAAERKAAEEAKITADLKAAEVAKAAVAAKAINDPDAAPALKEDTREFILQDGEIFLPGKKVYVAYYLADANDTLALDFVKLGGKNKTDTSDYFEAKQTEGGWIIRPKAGLHGTFLARADGNDHMIPVEILPDDFTTLANNDAKTGPREF